VTSAAKYRVTNAYGVAALLCLLASCASTPPDPFQGVQLRLGVDPQNEAEAVQALFEQAGYRLAKRVAGIWFTAMQFDDNQGQPHAVRVVTVRGIALALDAAEGSALNPAVRYQLLDATRDLRHDTHVTTAPQSEGLLVLELRGSSEQGEQCVRPYQVSRAGVVLGQQLDLPAQQAPVCAEAAEDRDGDGRVELTAEYRVEGLPLPVVPEVKALLFANDEGGYSRKGPQAALDAYYEAETSKRNEILKQRIAQQSAVEVYRLAVELALIAHLQGRDVAAQRALLTQAFDALPKDKREADWEKALVARVDEGW